MSDRYFFLQDFTGDCISVAHQEAYQQRKGCDVLLYARGSSEKEERILAHSVVLVHWSSRLADMVKTRHGKRAVSPEDPLVATVSCTDFSTMVLVMDMIYYGSARVPRALASEFVEQGAKMQLKFREETTVRSPDTSQQKPLWKRVGPSLGLLSGDSAYASQHNAGCRRPQIRKNKVRRIYGRDLGRGLQQKRKVSDVLSREEEEDRRKGGVGEDVQLAGKSCKRIRKKSEMENQIQLSPGSQVPDQGCDLLDLSIVPTIDSD